MYNIMPQVHLQETISIDSDELKKTQGPPTRTPTPTQPEPNPTPPHPKTHVNRNLKHIPSSHFLTAVSLTKNAEKKSHCLWGLGCSQTKGRTET